MSSKYPPELSIECFARNLSNQGCIAVLKENVTAGERTEGRELPPKVCEA